MVIRRLLNSLSSKNKRLLCITGIYFLTIEGLFISFSFIDIKPQSTSSFIDKRFASIIENIDSLELSIEQERSISRRQYYFQQSRKSYKHIEAVIEYVDPFFSKYYINGPAIKKHDIENGNKVFEPHGFQLIEPILFSQDTSLSKLKILYEIKLLKETISQTRRKFNSVIPRNEQYFDMIQMELVRITSLNLNGYDCSVTKKNITECSYILEGINELLKSLNERKEKTKSFLLIDDLIAKSNSYLLQNTDYNSFNRLHFITNYIQPLYSLVYKMKKEIKLSNTPVNYAINFEEYNLFGKSFFNRHYFSVNISDSINFKAQAELGKNLFFDPVLSGNNKRACASCHKPELAFADTISKSFEFDQTGLVKRNTPSLLNVLYQKNFFYDGRSLQLEDQVSDVLHAKNEMNSLPLDVVDKLRRSQEYKNLFRRAFKGSSDTAITFYAVLKSISEFEKTLISMSSRFDKYLQGNKKALNKNEINGYNVFSGKALCGSCHFLPLFNGLVPPVFNDNEFEVIGTPKNATSKEIDPDSGRVIITKKNIHLYSFKTPGLRNLEATFPYMHNGAYKTIEQVIDFYNKGGGAFIEPKMNNQTLPFDSLQLSVQEKADIKSFLLSLSDYKYKNIKPKRLPLFNDPVLDRRKVGGEY